MNCNNWDKCADVICRLSSRAMNEQDRITAMDNCNTLPSVSIEKSFYQRESSVGRRSCIEVSNDCSHPMRMCDDSHVNHWRKGICDTDVCGQLFNSPEPYRHPFALSKIFDDKQNYIEYIVSNVLSQVINHISLDSLHQLSCYLPQKIEGILYNVDMDSDRLVRVLVTDALQCYSSTIGQVTDWYAFASSIKLLSPSEVAKDDDSPQENQVSSKDKKKARNESNNQSESTTQPVSSFVHRKQFSESTAFSKFTTHAKDAHIRSSKTNFSSGTRQKSSVSAKRTQSNETLTPFALKHQPKTKFNEIQHYLFHHMPINQSSVSSDCRPTIHRKHRHRHDGDATDHHDQNDHPASTNYGVSSVHSSLSDTPTPDKELVNTSTMVMNVESIDSVLLQDPYVNSVETEQSFHSSLAIASTDKNDELSRVDSHRLLSSKDRKESNLSASENHTQLNTRPVPQEKKSFVVNPYPNMLADFD